MTATTADLQEKDIVTLRVSGLTGKGTVTTISYPFIHVVFEGGHDWSFDVRNDEEEGIEVLDVKRALVREGDWIKVAEITPRYWEVVDFDDDLNPIVIGQFGNKVAVLSNEIKDIYTKAEKEANDKLVQFDSTDRDAYHAINFRGMCNIIETGLWSGDCYFVRQEAVEALGEFKPVKKKIVPLVKKDSFWIDEHNGDIPPGHVKIYGRLLKISDAKDVARMVLSVPDE